MVTAYTGPVFTLAPEGQRQPPPPVGAPVAPVLPKPTEKTLANGLRVIVARSSDLPLVTADLTIKTGGWADPKGLSGVAGMTADMLTEGTKTRSARDIARQTEALGANLESSASLEASSVTLNVMPDKLGAGMAIMADVARNPAFATDELERQRAQSLDGLRVAYQEPGQVAAYAAAPVVFGGTPFGHVAAGTPGSIARLKPADLAALHAAWFRPDNAILVLTGDITAEQGFALAEKAFGGWAKPTAPMPAIPTVSPQGRPRAIVIDLPGAGQAAVNLAKPGIARSDPDYYPGIVANTLLGGGYSSRLNLEIRVKRGLSYGASSNLSANRTTGSFRAAAQTKNETAPQVLDLISEQMTSLGAAPGHRRRTHGAEVEPDRQLWPPAGDHHGPRQHPGQPRPLRRAAGRDHPLHDPGRGRQPGSGAGLRRPRHGPSQVQRDHRRRRQDLRRGAEGQAAGAGGDPGRPAGPGQPDPDEVIHSLPRNG